MGRQAKYVYQINDIVDDFKCIAVEKDEKGWTVYRMQCMICGKEKLMRGSTIFQHKGTKHKSCGKGLGITVNKTFYIRWQTMRTRTSPYFCDHKNYYDRGINSDAFASYKDFYDTMFESWSKHVKIYGEENTSLERIDVNKPYFPENCTWVTLEEQKGNKQNTIYFTVTDIESGKTEYFKNAHKYYIERGLNKYIEEVIKYNRTYQGKKYKQISKEEYELNCSVTTIESINDKKDIIE